MGKRRREPKPTGRKAVWEPDDELALLGLLDFCIKHTHFLPFKEANVVGRLCSVGSSHDNYSWDQINRKLDQLWRSFGSDDSLNKVDIYTEGSACLAGLSEDELGAVRLNVEKLEMLLKPRTTPRNRSLTIPYTRKDSSASPVTIKGDQNHTPEFDANDRDRLTPRAQRYQTRELARHWKWQTESLEGSPCEDDSPRGRTRRTEKDSQNRYNQRGKQGADNYERANARLGTEKLVLEDDGAEPISKNMKDNDILAVLIPENHGPHESTPLRLAGDIRRLQGDPIPSPNSLERIHKAALRNKEEKIIELQEAIKVNEEKLDDLQTKLDSFGSVQERRQEGEESLELLVSNLNQEIKHLKKAKDDCRNIGAFTKLAGSYDVAREEMHIETKAPFIRRLMKNILGGCEDDTKLEVPRLNISNGLRELLNFAFGLDLRLGLNEQTPLQTQQLEILISSRPPYSIIEALIEAAVCTWVLESGFPTFEQQLGELSLFTKYRELILIQDGAVALRNLELASYHALINTSRFHKLIDEEAEELASSLSKTLAPFFTRNAEDSEESAFETWGEEECVWRPRRQRLITIFKDALKLKADSLLTPERYELVSYAPGTVFDPATMDIETIDGAPVDTPAGHGQKVEHCLHVAIQAFAREKVKDSDSVSKATIQSQNFTRGDATRHPGGMAPTVLVKAVVVLRKRGAEGTHRHGTVEAMQEAI